MPLFPVLYGDRIAPEIGHASGENSPMLLMIVRRPRQRTALKPADEYLHQGPSAHTNTAKKFKEC